MGQKKIFFFKKKIFRQRLLSKETSDKRNLHNNVWKHAKKNFNDPHVVPILQSAHLSPKIRNFLSKRYPNVTKRGGKSYTFLTKSDQI